MRRDELLEKLALDYEYALARSDADLARTIFARAITIMHGPRRRNVWCRFDQLGELFDLKKSR